MPSGYRGVGARRVSPLLGKLTEPAATTAGSRSDKVSSCASTRAPMPPAPLASKRMQSSTRRGTSRESAIASRGGLGLRVYTGPASTTDEQMTALQQYGDSDREIADVVGVVALDVLAGALTSFVRVEASAVNTS